MERNSPEYESAKQEMYSKLSPRQKKYVDRIGYAAWDPFPMPFDPIDIRTEETGLTLADMVNQFLRDRAGKTKVSPAYSRGASEFAAGVMQKDDRYRAMYEFALWYAEHVRKMGKDMNHIWGGSPDKD
jgi:hypothetical protein